MTTSAEGLRLLLGLRLRALRGQRGMTLKAFGERTGLSISYLSEIEQGRKYPKTDKLLALASGLDVAYDDLVALGSGNGRGAVESLLESPLVGGFPFSVFGVRAEQVVRLLTESPERASALARAFVDLGRTYDLQLEDVLLAALRAYQEMNGNYFPDLEDAAAEQRREQGWSAERPPTAAQLGEVLVRVHGYAPIEEIPLVEHPELATLRSIYLEGRPPRLLVNPRLMASQRAFVLARELGYRALRLEERAVTSSWIQVDSFEQVLANFRASYFAGALLLDQHVLRDDVEPLFSRPRFRGDALLALARRRRATPELLFHRLTELLPRLFGLNEIFFLRFSQGGPSERPRLTKFLNLSASPVPHGVGGVEHYCRRWPSLTVLSALQAGAAQHPSTTRVAASRIRFVDGSAPDVEGSPKDFLVLAVARPLALQPEGMSSVALGLADTPRLREVIAFVDDPALRRATEVGLTCERCPLPRSRCAERAASPAVWRRRQGLAAQQRALAGLRHPTPAGRARDHSALAAAAPAGTIRR